MAEGNIGGYSFSGQNHPEIFHGRAEPAEATPPSEEDDDDDDRDGALQEGCESDARSALLPPAFRLSLVRSPLFSRLALDTPACRSFFLVRPAPRPPRPGPRRWIFLRAREEPADCRFMRTASQP